MTDSNSKPGLNNGAPRAGFVVLASIAVYLALLVYQIAPYDYNLSCLIRIGASNPFFTESVLEPGLVVFNDPAEGGDGYDGQFFYYTIKHLLMGEQGVPNPFRFQRILYPLLVYALAFGRAELLPASMLAVNLLAIAFSTLVLWSMVRNTPLRAAYLFLYSLNIGFLIAVYYDVATALCIGLTVAVAYFYVNRNLWLASAMIALALLAQENSSVVLAALCAWLGLKKDWRGAVILATAIVPWALWQGILWKWYGEFTPLMSGNHFRPPFYGMLGQIASFELTGGWTANLRELSVYPFMAFVIVLLIVSAAEMKKKPTAFMLILLLHALAGICFNREQIWGSTITSPARTLAGVFPFIVLCYSQNRSAGMKLLVLLSAALTAMGIARLLLMSPHPFYVT